MTVGPHEGGDVFPLSAAVRRQHELLEDLPKLFADSKVEEDTKATATFPLKSGPDPLSGSITMSANLKNVSRGSADLDISTCESFSLEPCERKLVSVELPHVTFGRLTSRSGLASNYGIGWALVLSTASIEARSKFCGTIPAIKVLHLVLVIE